LAANVFVMGPCPPSLLLDHWCTLLYVFFMGTSPHNLLLVHWWTLLCLFIINHWCTLFICYGFGSPQFYYSSTNVLYSTYFWWEGVPIVYC
jgi:hypothetical protein